MIWILAGYAAVGSTVAVALLIWRERKLRAFRTGRLIDVAVILRRDVGGGVVPIFALSETPERVAARVKMELMGRTRPEPDEMIRIQPGAVG